VLVYLLEPRQTIRLRAWHRAYGIALEKAHVELGRWLRRAAPPNATVALIDCGAIPYYSRLRTVDLLGLNDERIAHHGFSLDYFWARKPDIIVLTSSEDKSIVPCTDAERQIWNSDEFRKGFRFVGRYRWRSYLLVVFCAKGLALEAPDAKAPER
jgi:hypothetical protein